MLSYQNDYGKGLQLKLILIFLCFFMFLDAKEKEQNVVERGWRFGELDTNKNKKRKSPQQLLEELVKIQKESLEIQKTMLKKFDNYVDPKPKIITLKNGKKCIENSTAECFKMPLTNVAKKLPVLKNMILKPSKKTLGEWYKWQAKYFNKIERTGVAASLVLNGMGNGSFNSSLSRPNFLEPFGKDKLYKKKYQQDTLSKYSKDFKAFFFFGINAKLDKEAYLSFIKFANNTKNLNYDIYFKNMDSKIVFEILSTTSNSVKQFLKNAKKVQLNRKKFKKLNVYATPTLYIKLNNSDSYDSIAVARVATSQITDSLLDYLVYKNILKPDYLQDYKIWNNRR